MFLLLLSLLLPLVASTDFPTLFEHLDSNVDVSVDPCDNFFRHACSQSVNSSEFPFPRINAYYDSIAQKFYNISESRNLAILNDIEILREHEKKKFSRLYFQRQYQRRCKTVYCYRESFIYFSDFYRVYTNEPTDRLYNFISRLNRTNTNEILKKMSEMVQLIHDSSAFPYDWNVNENEVVDEVNGNIDQDTDTDEIGGSGEEETDDDNDNNEENEIDWEKIMKERREALSFYPNLMNRLFVMEKLKSDGIFEQVVKIENDMESFKKIIVQKLRETHWLNEKDSLGMTLLEEFEDVLKEMKTYHDLDDCDRDLKLLRRINGQFAYEYYRTRMNRATGIEALDVQLSLETAFARLKNISTAQQLSLIYRITQNLGQNAEYDPIPNRIVILAPHFFPVLTSNVTLNKHYSLFATIGHEIFHAFVYEDLAKESAAFKNGMECYNAHFKHTCDLYSEGSVCNSGAQTFREDGPDLEGQRVNYEFFLRNYREDQRNENVYESSSLNATREQAFFYLYAVEFCTKLDASNNQTDIVHSSKQVRVNGVVTQMPEFTKAFACNADQAMYSEMEQTCHLYGPNSK